MFKVPSSKFRKSERLVSQKLIDELFSKSGSHSMVAFPLRAVYTLHPTTLKDQSLKFLRPCGSKRPKVERKVQTSKFKDQSSNIKILISVPKKRFKHAVDRNRVKRQIREAYRHNKQLLMVGEPVEPSNFKLQTSNFKLQTVGEPVEPSNFKLQTSNFKLLIAFVWISDELVPSSIVNDSVKKLLKLIAEKL